MQLNTPYKNHQGFGIRSVSRWEARAQSHCQVIMLNFQRISIPSTIGFLTGPWQPCLWSNSSAELAVRTQAVTAHLWFWHSLGTSSRRKLVSFIVPTIVTRLPVPSAEKGPPQHDAATTTLHGRSAIRRVMSCARFPPDGELCFTADSSVSISSEQTLPLAPFKSLLSALFFCHVQAAALTSSPGSGSLLATLLHSSASESVASTVALPATPPVTSSSSVVLSDSCLGSWFTSLTEVFLGWLFRLDGLPGGVWVFPCFIFFSFSFFQLSNAAEIMTQKLLEASP